MLWLSLLTLWYNEPVFILLFRERVGYLWLQSIKIWCSSNMWSTAPFSFQCVIYFSQPLIPQVTYLLQPSSGQLYPLHAELNPICHLLALLGAHHILHISRIRDKVLGMCSSVIYVAQFTCLRTVVRLEVGNREQCRAKRNSLKQLYVARKWLYNWVK
jgi:hypothetical protein